MPPIAYPVVGPAAGKTGARYAVAGEKYSAGMREKIGEGSYEDGRPVPSLPEE